MIKVDKVQTRSAVDWGYLARTRVVQYGTRIVSGTSKISEKGLATVPCCYRTVPPYIVSLGWYIVASTIPDGPYPRKSSHCTASHVSNRNKMAGVESIRCNEVQY